MLKLVPDERVRRYELTVLTPGDFTSTEQKKVLDLLEELIKKLGGKVEKELDWGKKELAYMIKKQGKRYTEALYTHLVISLKSDQVPKLDKQILLVNDVIRHLLVVASDEKPTKLDTKEDSSQK